MTIELLQPEVHEVHRFDCGQPSLNHYLDQLAAYELSGRTAATFVLTGDGAGVLGYYTLAHILLELPQETLPVTHLARLAVDQGSQGRGFSEHLLMDALHRAWCASQQVPSYALVLDCRTVRTPLNSAFQRLRDQPGRRFVTFPQYEMIAAYGVITTSP